MCILEEVGVSAQPEVKVWMALPDSVEAGEETLRPFIVNALLNGMQEETADRILQLLKESKLQCWCVVEDDVLRAVAITEIKLVNYQRQLFVHVVSGAGFARYKNALDSVLCDFALDEDCKSIASLSRRGMVNALKDLDYHEDLVLMKKSLQVSIH